MSGILLWVIENTTVSYINTKLNATGSYFENEFAQHFFTGKIFSEYPKNRAEIYKKALKQ